MNIYKFGSLLLLSILPWALIAQCSITNTVATLIDCGANDQFSASLSFDYEDVGAEGFQLLGNGTNYGTFSYSDLPLVLENLDGDCATDYEFLVRDVANPACSNFIELGIICCEIDCDIDATIDAITDCNSDGSSVSLMLDITYQGVQPITDVTIFGADGFMVEVAADSFPTTISDVLTGTDDLATLIVCESGTDCCDTITYNNPCVCSIFDPELMIVDCDETDSLYYVEVDFEHFMTSDSFLLGYSGTLFGSYAYTDLPVVVGPFPLFTDDFVELLAVDQERNLCFNGLDVGIVEDCNFDCVISNLFAEAYGCTEGAYSVDVEFAAENIEQGQSFTIIVGDNPVDTFFFGQDLYTVTNVMGDNEQVVVVAIVGDSLCQDFVILEAYDCSSCNLDNLVAQVSCDTVPLLSFTADGLDSNQFYYILIEADTVGIWPADNADISAYENGTYTLSLISVSDSLCTDNTEFELSCTVDDCSLDDLSYMYLQDCLTDELFIEIGVTASGFSSDSFAVIIDGLIIEVLPYDSVGQTVGPLPLDCTGEYTLVVADNEVSNCSATTQLVDIPCCECSISIDSFTIDCLSDEVQITYGTVSVVNSASDSFSLVSPLGENVYAYEDTTIVEVYPLTSPIVITVTDGDNGMCSDTLSIDVSECFSDCELQITSAVADSCFGDTFDVNLDLAASNTSTLFTVTGNGANYGEYAYDDLPIVITGLEANTGIEYSFVVTDSEASSCLDSVFIGEVACITSTSELPSSDYAISVLGRELQVDLQLASAQLRLINSTGQLVTAQSIHAGLNQISLASYPVGVYFINISSERQSATEKIFIH